MRFTDDATQAREMTEQEIMARAAPPPAGSPSADEKVPAALAQQPSAPTAWNEFWHRPPRSADGARTPREASAASKNVDSNALPSLTGDGDQPGNMGPGNVRG